MATMKLGNIFPKFMAMTVPSSRHCLVSPPILMNVFWLWLGKILNSLTTPTTTVVIHWVFLGCTPPSVVHFVALLRLHTWCLLSTPAATLICSTMLRWLDSYSLAGLGRYPSSVVLSSLVVQGLNVTQRPLPRKSFSPPVLSVHPRFFFSLVSDRKMSFHNLASKPLSIVLKLERT